MYSPGAEPFGQVPTASSNLQHRRGSDYSATTSYTAATAPYSTLAAPSPYPATYEQHGGPAYSPYHYGSGSHAASKKPSSSYTHNTVILVVLVPCIWLLLTSYDSLYPLQTFLFTSLALYGLDLANSRQGLLYCIWISVVILTMVCAWFLLLDVDDDDNGSGAYVLVILLRMTGTALLWICAACWLTLQLQWMQTTDASLPRHLEQTLHSLLPPVASCIVTQAVTTVVMEQGSGRDTAATVAPFVFAGCMVASMMWIGSCTSCFTMAASQEDSKQQSFVLTNRLAQGHLGLLLLTPVSMHVAASLRRIASSYASTDDLYDWLLALTVPYLLLYGLVSLGKDTWPSPYATAARRLVPSVTGNSLRGAAIPMAVSVVASWCLQQRYLISVCHSFSYHFMGSQSPAWLISFYWTGATVCLCASLWIWGRKSTVTGEALFGDYHEDVVQLALALTGMALGKAFGLPWNFTPLPILAFLGLSLWITSRMLRYLLIFLFVLHATGVVVFTYRFAGIDSAIALPLPGDVKLSLARFGSLVVLASILVGLVAGLAVRSSGGVFAATFRRFDVTGILFIFYNLLLMILEITLLKRPVPTKELSGMEYEVDDVSDAEMLYDHPLAIVTSAVTIGITLFMKKVKILSARTSWAIVSLAIGKAVSVYIDAAEVDASAVTEQANGYQVFLRAIIASVLCIFMFAPRVFLEPVHLKSGGSHRHGRRASGVPAGSFRTIMLYAFVFLPSALVVAVPYVLFPLMDALASNNRGENYYSISPPLSELVGSAISLWGLACLSMLNYYLPDGGGEVWKKLSALAFLMGIGIFFAAPTVGVNVGEAASNPYASISSLGSQLISRGRSRTGGWGLLSAALATLLAITGPLELRERRDSSGRKDSLLLLRTMVFSLMFGGGVAWFIIMQSMSETEMVFLLMTTVACMTLAFLGTVAAVLGYFLDLDSYEDVEQITKMWMIALPAFVPVAGLPQLFHAAPMHPFGVGGWLSTYLVVGGITAFAFTLSLAYRKTKDFSSRGMGNLSCVIAWLCAVAVLYGRYGVAGLDYNFDVTTFFGVPASVVGTILVSPILLCLEGEKTGSRGSIQRVSASTSHRPTGSSIFRLNLPNLNRSSRFWPLVMGTVAVFLVASLYAILLRGSGFFFGKSSVARNHEDVFSNVFGSAAASNKDDNDLATLAKKTISQSQALMASAQLAGSGFWTSDSFFGPILHLGGVVATLPSLFLMYQKWWLGKTVPASQVLVALPLNAVPLFLCRGIPGLRATAVIGIVGGLIQLMRLRSADHQSQMRI